MCGLTGFIDPGANGSGKPDILNRMGATLAHRGPDDVGAWFDPDTGVGLAHRRLSVLDPSQKGHQPMISATGRYVVVYNGEIYNFRDLRRELNASGLDRGLSFRGHSDTEVLLAAVEQWGLPEAVRRFIGMFAFALWDKQERVLHLVRDRLGIKPMYYGLAGPVFLFGSELKALRAHPGFDGQINRNALALLMRHNYIPAPHSIYEGIHKLPPGTLLSLTLPCPKNLPEPLPYWSAWEAANNGIQNPLSGQEPEVVEQLHALLKEAVGLRMVSDVPLGAFLSGGTDSSTVVSLMQAQSHNPVKTFSIGFPEEQYDETRYARAVAQHLGTEHTELKVTPDQAMEVIPRLPTLYDEPFADASQIPTFLVSELAREHVTVTLSGDGGDELFHGYDRYFLGKSLERTLTRLPQPLKKFLSLGLSSLSPDTWSVLLNKVGGYLPKKLQWTNPGYKMHKLEEFLALERPELFYLGLVSYWSDPSSLVIGATEPATAFHQNHSRTWGPLSASRMMYLDTVSYLPDDILTKLDRASMGVALEARVPLLDHRVVELAWRVPMDFKVRDGRGKWILKQVLRRYLPENLVDRPKMGFRVPIGEWLAGPLRDWAEAMLNENRLHREGFLDPIPIRKKWTAHLAGHCDWQYYLWNVLMFQSWLEAQANP